MDRTVAERWYQMSVQEFGFCREELIDYFIGENIYQTTDEMLTKYYDAFL